MAKAERLSPLDVGAKAPTPLLYLRDDLTLLKSSIGVGERGKSRSLTPLKARGFGMTPMFNGALGTESRSLRLPEARGFGMTLASDGTLATGFQDNRMAYGQMYRTTIDSVDGHQDYGRGISSAFAAAVSDPTVPAGRRYDGAPGGPRATAISAFAGHSRAGARQRSQHPSAGGAAGASTSQHRGTDRSDGSAWVREAHTGASGPAAGAGLPATPR